MGVKVEQAAAGAPSGNERTWMKEETKTTTTSAAFIYSFSEICTWNILRIQESSVLYSNKNCS